MDEFLTERGWTLECKSPLEISHEDGSFATGFAAKIVIVYLLAEQSNHKFEKFWTDKIFKE